MTQDFWPTHAYVPGRTARHPDGAFDPIRETAKGGSTPEQLAQCAAFQLGLRYIHKGFFWEAHELLEPVWMLLPKPSRERAFVQGLIQLANGFLKLEMGRPKAAQRLLVISQDLLRQAERPPAFADQSQEADNLLVDLTARLIGAL
ncbi:MAG: DUF309 domain-containing protein [Marinovum sp.]|nr:DUF309 domain-containing protein [Marinovum sp.]